MRRGEWEQLRLHTLALPIPGPRIISALRRIRVLNSRVIPQAAPARIGRRYSPWP